MPNCELDLLFLKKEENPREENEDRVVDGDHERVGLAAQLVGLQNPECPDNLRQDQGQCYIEFPGLDLMGELVGVEVVPVDNQDDSEEGDSESTDIPAGDGDAVDEVVEEEGVDGVETDDGEGDGGLQLLDSVKQHKLIKAQCYRSEHNVKLVLAVVWGQGDLFLLGDPARQQHREAPSAQQSEVEGTSLDESDAHAGEGEEDGVDEGEEVGGVVLADASLGLIERILEQVKH